jgi:hypothetical protein
MKLPELTFTKVGDMMAVSAALVAGIAMYEMYAGHDVAVSAIVGAYTILLALSAAYYIHYETTPMDAFLEGMS